MPREPLINSDSYRCAVKMPKRRTGQIEARIAAKAQSNRCAHGAGSSLSIRKICNEELAGPTSRHFNQQLLIHELIRGSLGLQ